VVELCVHLSAYTVLPNTTQQHKPPQETQITCSQYLAAEVTTINATPQDI
jgi:hypothetical protein